MVSEPDHLANGAGDLVEDMVALGPGSAGGVADAMPQVIVEEADGYLLQGPGGRGDLGDHIGAPGVRVDHLLQSADLPLDLAQPPQIILLPGGVAAGRPGGRARAEWRAALSRETGAGVSDHGGHRGLPVPAGVW